MSVATKYAGPAPVRQLELPLPGLHRAKYDAPDGEQLVAAMAAGREWWRLRACDVAPWIRRLPVAIRADKYNRLGWLGRPWDGLSDLPVGEWPWDGESDVNEAEPLVDDIEAWDAAVVPGRQLQILIAELRRLIAARPGLRVTLPDNRDIRATLAGEEGDVSEPTQAMAVVDFDLGDMIIPIGLEDWQLREDTWRPVEYVAGLMVERLEYAVAHRRKLMRRERKMRHGFERDVARLGGGAAPLWLRMEPLRFDAAPANLFKLPYVALDVRLDVHQVWAPCGIERVKSPPELRKIQDRDREYHRRSVERLRQMRATGSQGWISDVALGLIELAGRSPAEVFQEESEAALYNGEKAHFGCDGHFGALFCHHGVLSPFFTFDKGSYRDGALTVDGRYPESLALAATGRPLIQYVDHPAFAAASVIDRVERSSARLRLFHTPKLITVEDAQRRWAERREVRIAADKPTGHAPGSR